MYRCGKEIVRVEALPEGWLRNLCEAAFEEAPTFQVVFLFPLFGMSFRFGVLALDDDLESRGLGTFLRRVNLLAVGLVSFQQLVLVEFILDVQKHHDHDVSNRILLIQFLVFLEVFAWFELLEVFQGLLEEVVLILQVGQDPLLEVGVPGRVLIALADHGVLLALHVAACIDPRRILQVRGTQILRGVVP